MDSSLIFSHPNKIKCCLVLDPITVLLVCDKQIDIINIVTGKSIAKYINDQQIMPITTWLQPAQTPNSYTIIIQGKMGYNYVLLYKNKIQITFIRKYTTQIHGFCYMARIGTDKLLGISEESKGFVVYDIIGGGCLYKGGLDDQKLCQSITCIVVHNRNEEQTNQDKIVAYIAQQSCKIYKFQLNLKQPQQILLQQSQHYTIQTNQQIKIINSLQIINNKLYCLVRKSPFLHILSLSPKLSKLYQLNLKLQYPRHLLPTIRVQKKTINNNSILFACSDGNKVIKIQIGYQELQDKIQCNVSTVAQIKQSKNIQYLSYGVGEEGIVLCGCTQQMQFFYVQLQTKL